MQEVEAVANLIMGGGAYVKLSTSLPGRRGLLSVAEAIALMISFGSLIATIILGVLPVTKNDKEK